MEILIENCRPWGSNSQKPSERFMELCTFYMLFVHVMGHNSCGLSYQASGIFQDTVRDATLNNSSRPSKQRLGGSLTFFSAVLLNYTLQVTHVKSELMLSSYIRGNM